MARRGRRPKKKKHPSLSRLAKSKNEKKKFTSPIKSPDKNYPVFMCTNANKKPSNTETDKSNNKDDINVQKTQLCCRRYEEYHDNFLSYDKIMSFLFKVQKESCGRAELVKIGDSTQGKPIYMMIITTSVCPASNSNDPKNAAFIQAGLNGENPFAISNALYMIDYLTKNPNFVSIMDYFIVPCAHPDAYEQFLQKSQQEKKDDKNACKLSPKPEDGESFFLGNLDDNPKTPYSEKTQKNKEETNVKRCGNNSKNRSPKLSCGGSTSKNQKNENVQMDLTLNFPVILGLNDMGNIDTNLFLEKIKIWKENYISTSPESQSILRAIYHYQFAIKLVISLQEGGQSICYPYGFCKGSPNDVGDLSTIAKKGKSFINGRQFQIGAIYDIHGLTYGNLIDFLRIDRSTIKFYYVIQVHKKTPRYSEKEELKQLLRYGNEIMGCVKGMSCGVYKYYSDSTKKRKVETTVKSGLNKKSSF